MAAQLRDQNSIHPAVDFLRALAPDATDGWTFQTFCDSQAGGARPRILHGTFEKNSALLARENERGAGIFVMVNAGDLEGRSNSNVIAVRALFVDIDSDGVQTVSNVLEVCKRAGLDPTAVIQTSPGRFSVFWRVTGCSLDQFANFQKRLARRFGTDASVCDLCRVMRVPGFHHRKTEPFESQLLAVTGLVHDAGALVDALAPDNPRADSPRMPLPDDTDQPTDAIARAEAGLAEGGRNSGMFKALCACRNAGMSRDEADANALRWAARCLPPMEDDEARQCLESAYSEKYLEADEAQRAEHIARTGLDEATERELDRLASLSRIAYARERVAAAKELRIGVSVLDDEVAARRPKPSLSDLARELLADAADPEPWPSAVDGIAVLDAMRARFEKHCRLPDHASNVLATWTLATWSLNAFDKFPFLRLHSATPGCGKSTVLDVLQRLCRRPFRADNVSPAVVYRLVDLTECSLLLDEAETAFANESSESLRGILNGGHTRMGAALRIVGENRDTPMRFKTWGPKVFAHLRQLPATVADRSLSITLIRARHDDRPARIKDSPEWLELRRKALRWALDHLDAIRMESDIDPPDWLPNRIGDNWSPMLAVAHTLSPEHYEAILAAARAAVDAASASESQDTGIALLSDIRAVFEAKGGDRIGSCELLLALTSDTESRWAEFSHGKPLTARPMARILREFGITPKTVRVKSSTGVGSTPRGYDKDQFVEVWARYLPALSDAGNSVVEGKA